MFNKETAIGRVDRVMAQDQIEAPQYSVLDSVGAVSNTIGALYEIVDKLEKRLSLVRESKPEECTPGARVQRGGSPLRNEIDNQNDRLTELYTRLVNLNNELDI